MNETIFCKYCEQEIYPEIYEVSEGPHYAKFVCPNCHRFLGWCPKPKQAKKKHTKFKASKLDIDYCELCGRKSTQLGKHETLEVHHKMPLEEGGLDEESNILVLCTACHRLAHWVRLYLNKHLNNDDNGRHQGGNFAQPVTASDNEGTK